MISVEGQFLLTLSIGNVKDFVTQEELLEFSITEYSGGLLPTYQLLFISSNEKILSMLHEGQTIKVQYGKSNENLEEAVLYVGELNTQKEGDFKRSYDISGFATSLSYVNSHHTKISEPKSAVEVILETAKRNFKKVETNISKSKDKQNWIQWGIPDRAFMSHLMIRSNLMPSFPAMAITADGTFIFKDILADVKEGKVDHKFVKLESDKVIDYDADFLVSSQPLYFNNWTGYEKVKKVLNYATGKIEDVSTLFKPVIAMANEIDKDPNIKYRFNGFEMQNENVHENFWKAFDHNLVHLSQMSKVQVQLSFTSEYRKVKPLDLVFFSESDNANKAQASEYNSGLYYVTRVTKSVQAKTIVTTVTLNRESINAIKNGGK